MISDTQITTIRIAGVDEVGRGPLVGSVVAAACILPDNYELEGLTDSKKISEKKRELLASEIKSVALAWSIAEASSQEVDEINVLQASLLAMKRSVESLPIQPEHVLVDGNKLPQWSYSSQAIIGGDGKEASISAASILAKVFRDHQMIEFGRKHPEYGFEKHKGYPTKQHMLAIQEYGVLPEHRRSFAPVKKILGK